MKGLLADLRHAARHEAGHAHIAGLLGVAGRIELSITRGSVNGTFVFAGQQALTVATAQRIAIAGAAATALHEDPEIDEIALGRRLVTLSGGMSAEDRQLCDATISSAALTDVLEWLRRDQIEVENLARRALARFGVGL